MAAILDAIFPYHSIISQLFRCQYINSPLFICHLITGPLMDWKGRLATRLVNNFSNNLMSSIQIPTILFNIGIINPLVLFKIQALLGNEDTVRMSMPIRDW